MNKEHFQKYLDAHKIWFPKDAKMEELVSAVARHRLSLSQALINGVSSCFGLWEDENSNCMTCDYEKACFKVSMGTEKEAYLQKAEKILKIRF